MKKLIYLVAFIAFLSITMISCGDKTDDPVTPSVNLNEPSYKAEAIKMEGSDKIIELKDKRKAIIKSLELTEGGSYIVSVEYIDDISKKSRAGSAVEYIMGLFKKNSDGSYELTNFGRLTINVNGVKTSITLIPTGEESFDIDVTVVDKIPNTELTNYLCRTWTIENTRLRGTIDGTKVAKDFPGKCNVKDLINYAKEKGANINDEIKDNTIIDGVTFTASQTFIINYANKSYDVGKWRWTKTDSGTGTISYSWDSADMGNSLESGNAIVEFTSNKCKLTIPVQIKNYNTEIVYTMK